MAVAPSVSCWRRNLASAIQERKGDHVVKKILLVMGLSTLLWAAVFAFKLQGQSELAESELQALPVALRDAAIQQRNMRLRLAGRTWVFALSGSSEAVTSGDVERAKMDLAMASKP